MTDKAGEKEIDRNARRQEKDEQSSSPAKGKDVGNMPGKDVSERINPLLTNSTFQKATYVIVVLLFLAALILIIVYSQKFNMVAEKNRAIARISKFMKKYNATFGKKTSIQILKGAEDVFGQFNYLYQRNDDVLKSIDDVYNLLKKNWTAFAGYMYEFNRGKRVFDEARKFCEQRQLSLPEIYSLQEQLFVRKEVLRFGEATWIGLRRLNRTEEWMWLSGRKPTKFYWFEGRPSNENNNEFTNKPLCVNLQNIPDKKPGYSWNDVDCMQRISFFCRMKPTPQWLLKGSLK